MLPSGHTRHNPYIPKAHTHKIVADHPPVTRCHQHLQICFILVLDPWQQSGSLLHRTNWLMRRPGGLSLLPRQMLEPHSLCRELVQNLISLDRNSSPSKPSILYVCVYLPKCDLWDRNYASTVPSPYLLLSSLFINSLIDCTWTTYLSCPFQMSTFLGRNLFILTSSNPWCTYDVTSCCRQLTMMYYIWHRVLPRATHHDIHMMSCFVAASFQVIYDVIEIKGMQWALK